MLRLKKIARFFYMILFLTQINFCGDEIAFKVKTAIVIDRALGEFINNLAMRDFGHKNSSSTLEEWRHFIVQSTAYFAQT